MVGYRKDIYYSDDCQLSLQADLWCEWRACHSAPDGQGMREVVWEAVTMELSERDVGPDSARRAAGDQAVGALSSATVPRPSASALMPLR